MKPESSLPYLQQPSAGTYPVLDECSLLHHTSLQ